MSQPGRGGEREDGGMEREREWDGEWMGVWREYLTFSYDISMAIFMIDYTHLCSVP